MCDRKGCENPERNHCIYPNSGKVYLCEECWNKWLKIVVKNIKRFNLSREWKNFFKQKAEIWSVS